MNKAVKVGLGIIGVVASAVGAAFGINEADKRLRYKADGYNRLGYDRDGYDRDGYNVDGYDRNGYDRAGFDRNGYDESGYNVDGYDRRGYNRYGRDARGFDIKGYDDEGFSRYGFDRQGYDRSGYDRCGHNKAYYLKKIHEMQENSKSAHRQMKEGHFEYALRDIRVGIEKGIKAALAHVLGKGYEENRLSYNIDMCAQYHFFTPDFIEKLRSAKNHCNDTAHEDCEKEYGQIHFCYKVLEELTEALKTLTYLSDDEG